MLSRHVKRGGARVVQLGGTTRDLFYYPEGTVQVIGGMRGDWTASGCSAAQPQRFGASCYPPPDAAPGRPSLVRQVIAAAPDLSVSLWEQAGLQARLPVRALREPHLRALTSQPGASADSVALLGALGAAPAAERPQLLREAFRVLRPGGTLVSVQRVRHGGAPLQALLGGGGADVGESHACAATGAAVGRGRTAAGSREGRRATLGPSTYRPSLHLTAGLAGAEEFEGLLGGGELPWDYVQWDLALPGLDPHAAGVAIKPLSGGSTPSSVDAAAFESLMRSGSRARRERRVGTEQRQQQQGGGKGFQ